MTHIQKTAGFSTREVFDHKSTTGTDSRSRKIIEIGQPRPWFTAKRLKMIATALVVISTVVGSIPTIVPWISPNLINISINRASTVTSLVLYGLYFIVSRKASKLELEEKKQEELLKHQKNFEAADLMGVKYVGEPSFLVEGEKGTYFIPVQG